MSLKDENEMNFNVLSAYDLLPLEIKAKVRLLASLGKKNGCVTLQQIDSVLSDSVVDSAHVESLMMILDGLGIRLLDEDDIAAFMKARESLDAASNALFLSKADRLLREFTDKQREVLFLRFGLLDGQFRSLEEVGRLFRITTEAVRSIEISAFRKSYEVGLRAS